MKKKVFTKDLKIEELMERLEAGEILYWEPSLNNSIYIKMYKGFPTMFRNDKLEQFNCTVYTQDGSQYFLDGVDEVEEPEADATCIGKLCWFWNDDESEKCRGVLEAISNEGEGLNFFLEGGAWFVHCRPLTADEVKQLVKE